MKLDRYTYSARLLPALIVSMPCVIFLLVALPSLWQWVGVLSALGISTAFIFLLAQCGRDAGRKKEGELFRIIGGKPTTKLLRHSDDTLPSATKGRYHDFLAANVPNFAIPSPASEANDPVSADSVYESAVDWLRAKTRDTKLHELLFSENISYGFRRNLWAMKPVGIVLCVIGILFIGLLVSLFPSAEVSIPLVSMALAVMVVQVIFWLVVINPLWVSIPAVAYAKTLLEFCDK